MAPLDPAGNALSSVTDWIFQLKEGERRATEKLWQRYYPRLLALARRQLRSVPSRAANEEDIVQESFAGFFAAVESGRYPNLEDRDDLWRVLLSVTINKAIKLIQHEERDKRDWKRTLVQSDADSSRELFREMLESEDPDPAVVVEVTDQLEWLFTQLNDAELVQIARLKLEGCTNAEIASRIDRAESTVERRVILIRRRLEAQMLGELVASPDPCETVEPDLA